MVTKKLEELRSQKEKKRREDKLKRLSKSNEPIDRILYTEQDRIVWKILMRDKFQCRNCRAKATLKIVPFSVSLEKIEERPCKAYTYRCFTLCRKCERKIRNADEISTFMKSIRRIDKWHPKVYGAG